MQPEEKVYFECQNEYTQDFIKDYNKFILFTNPKYLFGILLWPFYALIAALLCIFDVFRSYTGLILVGFAVVMAFLRTRQKKGLQKFYKRMLMSNNNKELRERKQFTQLGFHTENLDNVNQ
jgi:hypothetical protein